MPRLAGLLALGLLVTAGASAGPAAAARTVTPLTGNVRALAFSGDAVVVARQRSPRVLAIERIAPGASAQLLLRVRLDDEDDEVSLAASREGLGVALSSGGGGANARSASSVVVGPAAGPLREVAACRAGLDLPPVAVFGSRIAWREGGCGEPASSPRGSGPSAIVVGDADPSAPRRSMPVTGDASVASLVLGPGDTGLAGLQLGLDSEVRTLAPAGIGAVIAAERAARMSPVGILGDGSPVFAITGIAEESNGAGQGAAGRCGVRQVFTIAPGSGERRTVPLGGCPTADLYYRVVAGPRTGSDRIAALLSDEPDPGHEPRQVTLVSVRSDGSDRRALARGTLRKPTAIAAEGDRVGWSQPRCSGGSELVVQHGPDAAPARIASCRVQILTRRARVHRGRVAVRVRCPIGCSGNAFAQLGSGVVLQDFSSRASGFILGRGTHTLRLPVASAERASARLRLDVVVNHGPEVLATIPVRR